MFVLCGLPLEKASETAGPMMISACCRLLQVPELQIDAQEKASANCKSVF
jgi:hypothetical protein